MSLESKGSKRIGLVDVARGIAMICIVLGHLGIWEINRVVFTFHVPIFYLITGYFFKPEDSWGSFLKKKTRTLLLPYTTTSLLIAVLAVIINMIFHGTESGKLFLRWIAAALYGAGGMTPRLIDVDPIGALWFLLATFWGCLFLRIAVGMPAWGRIPFVMAVFLAGYLTRMIWYPFSIQAGGTALLFMYIGYMFRREGETILSVSKEAKVGFLILAAGVWQYFISTILTFNMVAADVGKGAVDIAGCLFACTIVFTISWALDKYARPVAAPLAFLGENSILVLCMHIIELNVFPWGKVLNRLQRMGLPETWMVPVLVGLKFLWIIPMTILCARTEPLRIIFGLSPKNK